MTNCPDDIKTLLSKLVDGEITPDERGRVDAHVIECAPCREMLDLFRKNETLLSNALGSEAFGNAVIESVVRSIRHEGPPEADPVEESPLEWLRARAWIPLSAAAVLLVGLLVLVISQSGEVRELRRAFEAARGAQDDLLRSALAHRTQQDSIIRDMKVALATRGVDAAYVADEGLMVKAGFDARDFAHFEVFRRGEKDVDFTKINTARGEERLRNPEYCDRSAKAGQLYWYKFRAVRANGEAVESAPIQMRAPLADELSPEQSVKIHCFDLAVTGDVGIFLLERVVEGRAVVEKFVVKIGEPVGGPVDVQGVRVNFTTGLTLGRVEEALETMALSYAEPVLDGQGRPIVETLKSGQRVPVTRQHEVPLSIRTNLRATFRTDAGKTAELFKGSWLRVKAK
ncbi:MAG TPA: zf-HC2 domain-containing protein [Planctomycetota bacterium]